MSKISKTMGTQMLAMKKEEKMMKKKIAHVFLPKYFKVRNKRDMFSRSIVELG